MIYCKLERTAVTLFVRDLFNAQAAACGADYEVALANPLEKIPTSSAKIPCNNLAPVGQDKWIGRGDLYGRNGVMVMGLTCCAALLFYDEGANLIGAGHAGGGVIEDYEMAEIKNVVEVDNVRYVVYATPTLKNTESDYGLYVKKLTELFATESICMIDGLRKMDTVIGDLYGNFTL